MMIDRYKPRRKLTTASWAVIEIATPVLAMVMIFVILELIRTKAAFLMRPHAWLPSWISLDIYATIMSALLVIVPYLLIRKALLAFWIGKRRP